MKAHIGRYFNSGLQKAALPRFLRNNRGGLLNAVLAVSDAPLERGEIVSTQGSGAGETQHFSAKPGDFTKGKRILVLINGGTASGSEILAGALQDNKRATLLGTDRGALRLTTSRYSTPSGASIQAKGILPDIRFCRTSRTR